MILTPHYSNVAETPTEVICATTCNLCPDYFPHNEYQSLNKSGGFCKPLNADIQSANFKPSDCPNNGQIKFMAIKF